VRRSVEGLVTKWSGAVSDDVSAATARAGEDARDWAVLELRALLERDIDEQRQTPLAIVRAAVRFPTAVLRQAGCRQCSATRLRRAPSHPISTTSRRHRSPTWTRTWQTWRSRGGQQSDGASTQARRSR